MLKPIALEFNAVSKSFERGVFSHLAASLQEISKKSVLKNISLKIHEGEVVFILGRSGAGKSVTLKHWAGLLAPDSGEALVYGINPMNNHAFTREKCGMIFQHPALFDWLSIEENIAFGLSAQENRFSKSDQTTRVKECLEAVGLPADSHFLKQKVDSISWGTQKRLSIARALALRPQILLFDEPTTGLDEKSSKTIHELMIKLAKTTQCTCVVVSHDMNAAMTYAERIIVLDEGRWICDDSPAGIIKTIDQQPQLIKDFLSDYLRFNQRHS